MNQILEIPEDEKQIVQHFLKIRDYTEKICQPLEPEDYVPQPMGDVSPPKWHLAHTTWFFEEFILKNFLKDYTEFHPEYNYVFNSYYRAAGQRIDRNHRGSFSRPSVKEVYAYRDHVNRSMRELLNNLKTYPDREKVEELLELGLNHEQQHQELLWTDIKFIIGNNPLKPAYSTSSIDSDIEKIKPSSKPVRCRGGIFEIGFEGHGFSYDNEHGRHKVYLEPFEIKKELVTNRDFLKFITSEGYRDFRNWLDEGWEFIQQNEIIAPLYWFEKDGIWYHYTLDGVEKVDLNEPVKHLSFFEADAYARWKGWRLPTEFEWEAVHEKLKYGQLWEWTSSAYLPYPRYEIPKGPTGEYNGKFMVNQKVLRGSSVATSNGHSRPTYRNFWHTDKRWQFTGFRLARTLS